VNIELKELTEEKAKAIAAAADEVLAGKHDGEFPLVVWQTGSGTQTNMNMNEVLANRAERAPGRRTRREAPSASQRRGQPRAVSNDVFPTAMSVAAVQAIHDRLMPALSSLRDVLSRSRRRSPKSSRSAALISRTRTPLTLGQEISGWVSQLDHGIAHVRASLTHLCELALGGTRGRHGAQRSSRIRRARREGAGKSDRTAFRFRRATNSRRSRERCAE